MYDDERTLISSSRFRSPSNRRKTTDNTDQELYLESRFRRNRICNLLAQIIKLWNPDINHKLKAILSRGALEIKRLTEENHQGIWRLLELLGDPTELIAASYS